MRSECSENSSLQNYGRTMSPTQLCARSRTRLQDTWCHIAIHIYTSLRFARLASGTKQGWGYVVVVFTVAILISGLHRQPVCFSARLAKRGFKRRITEGSQANRLLYSRWIWMDLAWVNSSCRLPGLGKSAGCCSCSCKPLHWTNLHGNN